MRRFLEQHLAFAGFLGVALSRGLTFWGRSVWRKLQWVLRNATGAAADARSLNSSGPNAEGQGFQTVGDMPRRANSARKGQVVYYAPGWTKSGPQS